MREQVQAYAPLRPLVLSLKALLKDRHLNEVVTGGMGTYALSNMVLAHLMEGRKVRKLGDDHFHKNSAMSLFFGSQKPGCLYFFWR